MCPEIQAATVMPCIGSDRKALSTRGSHLRGRHTARKIGHSEAHKSDEASGEKPAPGHGNARAIRQVVPNGRCDGRQDSPVNRKCIVSHVA
jgi:hypothetical protein